MYEGEISPASEQGVRVSTLLLEVFFSFGRTILGIQEVRQFTDFMMCVFYFPKEP